MTGSDSAEAGSPSGESASRVCTNCHETKALEDFGWRNKEAGTRLSQCKTCRSTRARATYVSKPRQERFRGEGDRREQHCGRCDTWKLLTDFHWANRERGERQRICAACANEVTREYGQRFPEKRRDSWNRYRKATYLVKTYGITLERYAEIFAEQGGVCAICLRPGGDPRDNRQPLHVDHDHACCATKKTCGKCVRGLLCKPCNIALGAFEDKVPSLQRAIEYLQLDRG